MDSLGFEVGVFVIPLRLSVVLSAYAAVVFFCVRSESVPRIGWALRFGPLSWGPPEPVARPLVRGHWVGGLIVLGVLAIIQVQPAVWISQAGSDSVRSGLIGLSTIFYLLELAWWVWLLRLPREKIYSTLPQDKGTRDRLIVDEVARFDAAYRARQSEADPAQIERSR